MSLESVRDGRLVQVAFLSALSMGVPAEKAQAAEARSYVVSWFGLAANSSDGDCSQGVHPSTEKVYARYLDRLGLPPTDVEKYRTALLAGKTIFDPTVPGLSDVVINRGRIDGKPVNAWRHPAAVPDVDLPGLDGKLAYGFNLDGEGERKPNSFEDPQTHERGVENQLYRAVGCARAMRGTLNTEPTYWKWLWDQLRDSMPAWLITIKGEDLSKDGPVTVDFDRAVEHARANPDGSHRRNMSYRVDTDPRSHNEFQGEIKNRVLTIRTRENFRWLADPLVIPEIGLSKFNTRLYLKPDGSLDGFIGGFQNWHMIYGGLAGLAIGGESSVTGDIVQYYHLMRKNADADPDPATGQNMSISAAYYLKAVPAFTASPTLASNNAAQQDSLGGK